METMIYNQNLGNNIKIITYSGDMFKGVFLSFDLRYIFILNNDLYAINKDFIEEIEFEEVTDKRYYPLNEITLLQHSLNKLIEIKVISRYEPLRVRLKGYDLNILMTEKSVIYKRNVEYLKVNPIYITNL